jgi:hypothetical protein
MRRVHGKDALKFGVTAGAVMEAVRWKLIKRVSWVLQVGYELSEGRGFVGSAHCGPARPLKACNAANRLGDLFFKFVCKGTGTLLDPAVFYSEFIPALFNDALSTKNPERRMLAGMMNDE